MHIFGKKKVKIFCLSMQKTGTTSVGQFFKDFGYKVATYQVSAQNEWSLSWFRGDYEKIFKSESFINNQVFEDNPWWYDDFYKIIYHRFPESKFILVERDANKWFDSMVNHSGGKSLGNTHRHAKLYGRMPEYHNISDGSVNAYTEVVDNLLDIKESHRHQYKMVYKSHNTEVKKFFDFHSPKSLFTGKLEDKHLWQKLGRHFAIDVPKGYTVHKNPTKKRLKK